MRTQRSSINDFCHDRLHVEPDPFVLLRKIRRSQSGAFAAPVDRRVWQGRSGAAIHACRHPESRRQASGAALSPGSRVNEGRILRGAVGTPLDEQVCQEGGASCVVCLMPFPPGFRPRTAGRNVEKTQITGSAPNKANQTHAATGRPESIIGLYENQRGQSRLLDRR
ncbi:hypothetical protein DSECCO2_441250 [anaerobic digester metagenome]